MPLAHWISSESIDSTPVNVLGIEAIIHELEGLDVLGHRGLLCLCAAGNTRQPDPADRRSSRVMLTDKARAALPGAAETLFQGNRDALDGMTDVEIRQLVTLLGRVIDNLDRMAKD